MNKVVVGALFSTMFLFQPAAHAEQYPSKRVELVIPFAAGGSTDIIGRRVAHGLSELWDVPVIVENKAGASGTIGTRQVVQSENDGYKLLFIGTHHVINPSSYTSLPYDTINDLTNVSLIASVPNILVIHESFPAQNVEELLEQAREQPGEIDYASSGAGGSNHLAGELFKLISDVDMQHVPYNGEAPAIQDLMGGHVPVMFAGLTTVTPAIKSGKVRPLAVTVKERLPQFPDVPTLHESGVENFEAMAWFGLYGPANLPDEVVKTLRRDVAEVLKSPEVSETFQEIGARPPHIDQSEFPSFVKNEIEKWGEVFDKAGIERIDSK